MIQNAQAILINKCDLRVSKLTMKELLNKAYRDLDTFKIPVENRMNKKRLTAMIIMTFLSKQK